jgi:lipopolysaccharide/colanic/teichoic acid biosynthesis glycosyltransferase
MPAGPEPAGTGRAGLPRAFEATAAGAGLVLVSPLVAAAALLVALSSPGPVFFRQERVGRHGKIFRLYKLRTMREAAGGPAVTAGDDARITRVGRMLRRSKLDELPQLWNVLKGDMALVGPRPEVPRYVDPENRLWRRVLQARPGLTDPVSLALRDEEEILAAVRDDRERFYRERLLPWKLEGYARYLARRSWKSDLGILVATLFAVLRLPRARSLRSFPLDEPPPPARER